MRPWVAAMKFNRDELTAIAFAAAVGSFGLSSTLWSQDPRPWGLLSCFVCILLLGWVVMHDSIDTRIGVEEDEEDE